MKNLKVLYLKGNPVIRNIPNYRKTMIKNIDNLTYLDERPVNDGDRIAVMAFFSGGLEEERKAREEYRLSKDTGFKVREADKEYFKATHEERKKKALESLENEYSTRKKYLENKKRKLLADYEEFPEKKNLISTELSVVDFQIEENERFKNKEENNIIPCMSKRATKDKYSVFEYEEWMEAIVETHVVENLFDFPKAIILIHDNLKNKNVKNWDLFNELDLRSIWTEIELKRFRKDEEFNLEYEINREIGEIKNIEKDKLESKKIEIKEANIEDIQTPHHKVPIDANDSDVFGNNIAHISQPNPNKYMIIKEEEIDTSTFEELD